MRLHPRTFLVAGSIAALTGAGCGGGGGGSAAPPALASPGAASALQLFPLATAVASPPPGQLGVQDITMNFTAVNASQYVLALEPGFAGTFTAKATANCVVADGYASPPPAPVTVAAVAGHSQGPQAVFQVTAVAAGTCALKFNDGTTTNNAEILVTVTQSVGTVQ